MNAPMNGAAPRRGRKPAVGEPLLERAFRILQVFRPSDRSLSLTTLVRRSQIPKSTVLRLTRKLVDVGALERLDDGTFVVGLGLLEIASLAPRGHGLRATALPYLEDLHAATHQHVLLGVRDGQQAVLVERLSARDAADVLYRVGGRLPLYGTGVGLCLLAHAPADFQNEVLRGNLIMEPEHHSLTEKELRAQLAAVRRDGIAVVSRPNPDMTSVAGPIFGPGNAIIAALSVVAPTATTDPRELQPAVAAVCRAVSRAMLTPTSRPITATATFSRR